MEKDKSKKINFELLFVISFFAISVIVRFLIGNHIRNIVTIPDEYRYYLIASGIYTGQGLSIHNFPTAYQKILYSFFISPAFSSDNIYLRFSLISLINSLLISSGIFPYYLLIKKILKNQTNIIICTALYILFSDLSYSHTLMSEILFLPLSIWFIYLFYISFIEEDKKYYIHITMGIVLYATYLTKEIALVFPIAYFFIILYKLFKKEINLKSEEIKKFLIFITTFIILFIIFKLTLFAGSGNSYDQQSIDVLFKPQRIEFLIYSFFWFIAMFIVTTFILPIILPILNYDKYSKSEKTLYNSLILLLILTSFVISYTISIREDLLLQIIRFHGRYVGYLYLTFLIYFCKSFEIEKNLLENKKQWIISILIIVFSFLFLRYDYEFDLFHADNTIGLWIRCLSLNAKSIIPTILYLSLFIFSFLTLYIIDKKKISFYCFIIIYVFSMYFNTKTFYEKDLTFLMRQFHIQNTDYIKTFIKLNSDKLFAYKNNKKDMGLNESTFFDTFNSNCKNIIYTYSHKDLNSKMSFEFKLTKNIDYIVTINRIENEMPSLEDVDEIPIKNKLFKIFKIKDKNKFPKLSKFNIGISTSILGRIKTKKYLNVSKDDSYIKLPQKQSIKGPFIDLPKGIYEIEIKSSNDIKNYETKIISLKKLIKTEIKDNKILFSLENDTKSVGLDLKNITNKDIIINDITLKKLN